MDFSGQQKKVISKYTFDLWELFDDCTWLA